LGRNPVAVKGVATYKGDLGHLLAKVAPEVVMKTEEMKEHRTLILL